MAPTLQNNSLTKGLSSSLTPEQAHTLAMCRREKFALSSQRCIPAWGPKLPTKTSLSLCSWRLRQSSTRNHWVTYPLTDIEPVKPKNHHEVAQLIPYPGGLSWEGRCWRHSKILADQFCSRFIREWVFWLADPTEMASGKCCSSACSRLQFSFSYLLVTAILILLCNPVCFVSSIKLLTEH